MSKLPENCPICGKKMKDGSVVEASFKFYNPYFQWLYHKYEEEKNFPLKQIWLPDTVNYEGIICDKCEIILFSFNKEDNELLKLQRKKKQGEYEKENKLRILKAEQEKKEKLANSPELLYPNCLTFIQSRVVNLETT